MRCPQMLAAEKSMKSSPKSDIDSDSSKIAALSGANFMDKAKIAGAVDWVFDDQGRMGKEANK